MLQFIAGNHRLLPCEVRGCEGSYYRGNRPGKVFEHLIRLHVGELEKMHQISLRGGGEDRRSRCAAIQAVMAREFAGAY